MNALEKDVIKFMYRKGMIRAENILAQLSKYIKST